MTYETMGYLYGFAAKTFPCIGTNVHQNDVVMALLVLPRVKFSQLTENTSQQ